MSSPVLILPSEDLRRELLAYEEKKKRSQGQTIERFMKYKQRLPLFTRAIDVDNVVMVKVLDYLK